MNKKIEELLFDDDSKQHYMNTLNRASKFAERIENGELDHMVDFESLSDMFVDLNAVARIMYIGLNNGLWDETDD